VTVATPAGFLAILTQSPRELAWFSASQASHSAGEANAMTGRPFFSSTAPSPARPAQYRRPGCPDRATPLADRSGWRGDLGVIARLRLQPTSSPFEPVSRTRRHQKR